MKEQWARQKIGALVIFSYRSKFKYTFRNGLLLFRPMKEDTRSGKGYLVNNRRKRPNFLIITTDEERFPPPYENDEAKAFRLKNSAPLAQMRRHGLEFRNHHAAATACAPSRTTIYTGQYPSLHGVSQTPGVGKSSFDENMFWLKPNTVPTLGNYFRQADYQTWYRGKWHISYEDIDVPGTQIPLMSNDVEGNSFPDRISLYAEANRLDKFGFTGWIGPEPHGSQQANDGTIRDPGFANQVCRLLADLDRKACSGEAQAPFLLVASFVNPHDIVFSGVPNWFPDFEKARDSHVLPYVAPAPTAKEPLESKPRCQKDYVYTYPRMYIPQPDSDGYRQFYYYLMAEVNKHIEQVYQALQNTSFFDNTIVIYTSDHGEMLGAHGGFHQKWYNAYRETLHVPMIISNPKLFPQPQHTDNYTSHVDLMPTLLGLAGIHAEEIRQELAANHSEAQPLVGRNLSGFVCGEADFEEEPIYFMTDDNVEVGSQMYNLLSGQAYNAIVQPNHLETVITKLPQLTGATVWKYTRYFDNARFYADAAVLAKLSSSNPLDPIQVGNPENVSVARFIPSEYECYNLTDDPLETQNLTSPIAANPFPDNIRQALESVLKQQRRLKRLHPKTLNREPIGPSGPLRS